MKKKFSRWKKKSTILSLSVGFIPTDWNSFEQAALVLSLVLHLLFGMKSRSEQFWFLLLLFVFVLIFWNDLTVYPKQLRMAMFSSSTRTSHLCFHLTGREPFQTQRIQRTTQRVMDAERITRGIPTFRPSFLTLTLRVSAAWIQQVNVPNPKVKEVPTLWISSSFVS